MREARTLPGRGDDYAAWLAGPGGAALLAADGCLGVEVYRSYDGPDRVVQLSHWRDEAALSAYAGPSWASEPLVVAAEREFLARQPHVWHFHRVSGHFTEPR